MAKKKKKITIHGYYIDSNGSWDLYEDSLGKIIKRFKTKRSNNKKIYNEI